MLKSKRHVDYIRERSPGICEMLLTEHDWRLLFNQNHVDPVVGRDGDHSHKGTATTARAAALCRYAEVPVP